MSNLLDPDRSITRWLTSEAPDRAPERLLEAARAQVSSTAQRRSLQPVRRFQAMNSYAKLGIAAAAVLAIAVVGINLGTGVTTPLAASPSSSPPTSPDTSPTPVPTEAVAPQPPVEFTGLIKCGPPVRGEVGESLDVGDDGTVVSRQRGGAWQQTLTMSDPRLEGTIHHTYEADVYRLPEAAADGPEVTGYTWRITNDGGTWELRGRTATVADGTPIGEPADVLVGSGGYQGLIAMFEVTEDLPPCDIEVRGVIFEGAPVPEPYVAE